MGRKVEIEIAENADGTINTSAILIQLEREVGNRFRVTDFVDESILRDDYPGIDGEQVIDALTNLSIGDYDSAIDRDIRRDVLNEAVSEAGFDVDAEFDDADLPTP